MDNIENAKTFTENDGKGGPWRYQNRFCIWLVINRIGGNTILLYL